MRGGRAFLVLGLLLAVAGLGWGLVSVTLMAPRDRADASGYGQFVLAALGLLLAAWPYVHRLLRDNRDEVDLDELADRLAVAVRAQWTAAAGERGLLTPEPLPIRWRASTGSVSGPVSAATAPRTRGGSFPPLPGLASVTPNQLREGTHRMLHRVYGGLASGRLILTGGPGAGKSSAAVLLLLEALTFRDRTPPGQRAHVPVPVLFTLTGWDPDSTPVDKWLTTRLSELGPLTGRRGRHHASRLLAARRIAVFLDGLDELPENHRPTALRALARQATSRLVLLTRTAELTTAARHHILTGAVALELQPLTPKDAATYLRHGLPDPPPTHWARLLTTLATRPAAPVTRALDSPLTITLLRDTYQRHPAPAGTVDELLDSNRFPDPRTITDHLLDHAITTAYTSQPGEPPPPYTPETAHHTLTFVARQLRDHGTRDLAWWHIPTWTSDPRTITIMPIIGMAYALVIKYGAWSMIGLAVGLAAGLEDVDRVRRTGLPVQFSRYKRDTSQWRYALGAGAMAGIGAGLVAGVRIGITGGVTAVLAVMVIAGLTSKGSSKTGHPNDLWRGNLLHGVLTALPLILGFGLLSGLREGVTAGVMIGFTFAFMFLFAFIEASRAAISQVLLALRYRTPLRLGHFLADAHARHLLRTVGPVYQFRHATLQDRLAPPSTTAP